MDITALGLLNGNVAFSEDGRDPRDPQGWAKMPDGIREVFLKDTMDKLMEFYGIPKKREVVEGDKLVWLSNKNNPQVFLAAAIKPEHAEVVDAHFTRIGMPFPGGYLAYKSTLDGIYKQQSAVKPVELDPITNKPIIAEPSAISEESGIRGTETEGGNDNPSADAIEGTGNQGSPSGPGEQDSVPV